MPIADLFARWGAPPSAPTTRAAVGAGRDGRDRQERQALALSRPAGSAVGTVGPDDSIPDVAGNCPDRETAASGQGKVSHT